MGDLQIIPEDWVAELDLDRYFKEQRPLEVDVGCGKGGFLISRAAAAPERNFLGIDRMLRRIRKVENKATRAGIENLRLLRMDATYAVGYMLPAMSVAVYYVFFPDPWPKERHKSNRFFDSDFLEAVKRTLEPGGTIHVATDHGGYFEEIEAMLMEDPCFDRTETFIPKAEEQTEFERYYIQHTEIGRCSFCKRRSAIPAGLPQAEEG